ncbi:MAG: histidinol-phosphate transaminase [Terriglobales bacterium]
MLNPREAVRNLPLYHPPLAGRDGLRLDFNENTVGCSPRVLECLRQLSREALARYPENKLAEAITASHLGIDPEELLLTNGTDEAIHLLCEAFLEPQHEVLIAVPTFSMYEIYAAATGAKVIKIPAGKDFAFPFEELLARITDRTRLIAVANPNNPTGTQARCEDLLEIARRAPQAALLIDEAYYEFSGDTLLPRWRGVPNLFIARTLSKAYGLAGLRLGMLAGHAPHIEAIRKVSSPYSVNAVALACLPAALADQDYVRNYVEQVCRGRDQLQQALSELRIPFWPSRANFVLTRLGTLSAPFISGMRKRGILVRDRSSDFGCEGCVRITLGTLAQTEPLLVALRQTVEEIRVEEANLA